MTDTFNMDDALYLRVVRLTIVPKIGLPKVIDGLKISFEVEKTNESNPNTANINAYNLSAQTRSLLESTGTRIILEAGYKKTVAVIFKGNVTKVKHNIEGVDTITEIEGGDGDNAFRNMRIDRGFPPGATTKSVIDAIANEMKLPVGAKITQSLKKIYANGLTLSGYCRDQLDDICETNDLEWSIQDESLQIVPKTGFVQDTMILINSKTGMVGSPSKTDKGIEFKSLLQPRLNPGRRVKIESRMINGIFKLRKVEHKGDSRDGEFLSICEATTK